MWKKKMKQRQPINKKWYKYLGMVCVLGILLMSIVLLANSFQEKEKVSAHPTNIINLGSGNTGFDVPIDATKLEEDAIKALTPTYDDYVQREAKIPILNKETVRAYGSPEASNGNGINCTIMDVEETEGGNYFVLFQLLGSSAGGILRTAVYNKKGEQLAVNNIGTRHDYEIRVMTKLFNKSGNDFLVNTFNGKFYKYTVNETPSSVTIQRKFYSEVELQNGDPRTGLRTDYASIIDQFSNYSDEALITGRSYYVDPANPASNSSDGIYRERVSIGRLETGGWTGAGFDANSEYRYTLESLLIDQDLNLSRLFNVTARGTITPNLYRNSNYVFGPIMYIGSENGGGSGLGINTFQVFDINNEIDDDQVANSGSGGYSRVKERIYQHLTNQQIHDNAINGIVVKYSVVKNLCDADNIYFFADDGTYNELIRVHLPTLNEEVVKQYPTGSILNLYPDGNGGFAYYGSTPELEDEFYSEYFTNSLNGTSYFISGIMNGDSNSQDFLNVNSLRAFVIENAVNASFALEGEGNKIFIAGDTVDYNTFPTHKYMIDEDADEDEFTRDPIENEQPSGSSAFIGILEIKDDYSPAISKLGSITVDINDPAIKTPTDTFENPGDTDPYRGWNTLDRWLITGTKNGKVDDTDAVKVYDHFDNNDPEISDSEEWLQKRINRNPKDALAAIEWNKLGFDATKAGPQLVTYFVTDTQSQASTISRWVNKKTSETIVHEDGYMLDAQNFHIPLTGIDTAIPEATQDEKFKELAKAIGWNTTDGKTGEVTVNQKQLEALRNAKVAKPYPVDVTYEPKAGVKLTNRVWVFVTTKNTVPNSSTTPEVTPADTNGVVYYADDYSLPFRLRGQHTDEDVRTRGNIRIYNYYDASNETSNELPTLVDMTNAADRLRLNVNHIDMVNNIPTGPGVINPPINIEYVWDRGTDNHHTDGQTTIGSLDITLTGDVLLHVRQVVLNPSAEVVIPQEGYVKIENRVFDPSEGPILDPTYQTNAKVNTQEQTDPLLFTTFAVSVDHLVNNDDEVLLSLIIPEHYRYTGHFFSHGGGDPGGQNHDHGHQWPIPGPAHINRGTIILPVPWENGEFWVTFYIQPNEGDTGDQRAPQPYSWDYKENNLGQIKTKEEEE